MLQFLKLVQAFFLNQLLVSIASFGGTSSHSLWAAIVLWLTFTDFFLLGLQLSEKFFDLFQLHHFKRHSTSTMFSSNTKKRVVFPPQQKEVQFPLTPKVFIGHFYFIFWLSLKKLNLSPLKSTKVLSSSSK